MYARQMLDKCYIFEYSSKKIPKLIQHQNGCSSAKELIFEVQKMPRSK